LGKKQRINLTSDKAKSLCCWRILFFTFRNKHLLIRKSPAKYMPPKSSEKNNEEKYAYWQLRLISVEHQDYE
jgi:hypothetical protein